MKTHRFFVPGFLVPAIAALLVLGGSAASRAQDNPDTENLRNRLSRVEKQLGEIRAIVLQARATGQPVEIKPTGPDPQVADLQAKFDDLTQTLRGMTGQLETLTHDLDQSRKDTAQSQAQQAALADRLDHLEKQVGGLSGPPPPPAPPASDAAAGPASPPEDAKTAYAHARKLLLDGDYPAASAAFQDYIDRFGDTASAPAARYWLGETKYIESDYAGAATALIGAIHGWPKTTWAPDAVVKLSLALVQLKKSPDACRALAELDRHYPKLPAATRGRAEAARSQAGCGG